ncbi:MAG: recombinase family protein [Candidatus Shapirobacteria bacterium]|nr:recombinase family protein [Candidatus Shapirobacteria bacterium]
MEPKLIQPTQYCLYARKSSESDERQAMSIDSQIKEMTDLAKKENLSIKDVLQESHSAKNSGQRPVFMKLLNDIRTGIFDGILTWAPDRLSRNAGDLGMLVDLMDQGKLIHIKTFSQAFSNNPNEKFLLMILCSQAKLENDQKGINVKRGIRAKCEKGWRPGPAPIGYYNRSFNGTKDIVVDPDRGKFVTEMYERTINGESGRSIKKWADKVGFTNRSGKSICLSQIFKILSDSFYYSEFEYPVKSGVWYKGSHPPLITKDAFLKVQQLKSIPPKAKWGSRNILFRGIFKCAGCNGTVTGEEKFRKRKVGEPRHHVYYHCGRVKDPNCREPFLSEEELIKSLLRFINFMAMAHPQTLKFTPKLKQSMDSYNSIREETLIRQDINPNGNELTFLEYAQYILRSGSNEEKIELTKVFGKQLYIHNKEISGSPIR